MTVPAHVEAKHSAKPQTTAVWACLRAWVWRSPRSKLQPPAAPPESSRVVAALRSAAMKSRHCGAAPPASRHWRTSATATAASGARKAGAKIATIAAWDMTA